jgi:hypothetical protein
MFSPRSFSTVCFKGAFGSIVEKERRASDSINHNYNSDNLHDNNNWNEKGLSRPSTRRDICSVFVVIRDWWTILSPMVLWTASTCPTLKYFWNDVLGNFTVLAPNFSSSFNFAWLLTATTVFGRLLTWLWHVTKEIASLLGLVE